MRARYHVVNGVPVRDVQYQYDLLGNRQVVTEDGASVQYTVNNLNQYLTVGGEPLSWDANGNLVGAPGLVLQYDASNRLIAAAKGTKVVFFAYDGRHRCVKRTEIDGATAQTTIMIWGHEPSQGWGLLEERGPSGELLARHAHGPSVDDLVLSELNGAVYYYHHDHLNSTVAVTDESSNVVEQYRYDVYGDPFFYGPDGTPRAESALGLRFLFTGREWLASLALYDYRHRIYSPSLGRFLQMDPLGFAGGHNIYLMGMNSVVFLTDPFGLLPPWYLRPSTVTAVIGGIIGAMSVFNPAIPFIGALSISLFGHSMLFFLWLEAEEEEMERRERDREIEELKRRNEELNKEIDQLRKRDPMHSPEDKAIDKDPCGLAKDRAAMGVSRK